MFKTSRAKQKSVQQKETAHVLNQMRIEREIMDALTDPTRCAAIRAALRAEIEEDLTYEIESRLAEEFDDKLKAEEKRLREEIEEDVREELERDETVRTLRTRAQTAEDRLERLERKLEKAEVRARYLALKIQTFQHPPVLTPAQKRMAVVQLTRELAATKQRLSEILDAKVAA